jgi:1-deoxy-D-xylulose-5-phosphate reductoisomerase
MPIITTVLGSTGSIGVTTLKVLRMLKGEFRVYGLSCRRNLALLEEQIEEFSPRAVAVESQEVVQSEHFKELKKRCSRIEFLVGEQGIEELASRQVDILVSAIVGAAGLKPTVAAVPHVRRIALANKETLVMAGSAFIERVREHHVELIPVDSEHSALFSLIGNINRADITKLILTASGGSLRDRSVEELAAVTPEEALAHPNWEMGDKITIDSATMMNKGFEVIEAHHLFGIDYDRIDVIIHPESIVHSMVETRDGALFAHMGVTAMAHPILYALVYPERRVNPFGRLELEKVRQLQFVPFDDRKYPALQLCIDAGKAGGTMPTVLNAANEIAVDAFLKKRLVFTDIVKVVEKTISVHEKVVNPDLTAIFNADSWAREKAQKAIRGL